MQKYYNNGFDSDILEGYGELDYLTEKEGSTNPKSVKTNIENIYEYILKLLYCQSNYEYYIDGWVNTIFRCSCHIASGIAQNNYKLSQNELENIYHNIRNKVLINPEFKYMKTNERIIPYNDPEIYNINILYRDDLLYDFILQRSKDKELIRPAMNFYFNKYRSDRKLLKKRYNKIYIGDGNYKFIR